MNVMMRLAQPKFLKIGQLRTLCAEWQERLGLQAYVIHLSLVPCSTFDDHRTLGDVDASRVKRKAWIRMLDTCDDPDVDDHETCLIPSRLFSGDVAKLDEIRFQLYEQGIDQLARTLVATKRATPSARRRQRKVSA